MPAEPRPEDYENWLACPVCYAEIPLYETYQDTTIQNVVETNESAFDAGKTIIESLPNRTGKRIKSRNKIKKKNVLHDDPDINEEMKRHGTDNVRVLQDSNP